MASPTPKVEAGYSGRAFAGYINGGSMAMRLAGNLFAVSYRK